MNSLWLVGLCLLIFTSIGQVNAEPFEYEVNSRIIQSPEKGVKLKQNGSTKQNELSQDDLFEEDYLLEQEDLPEDSLNFETTSKFNFDLLLGSFHMNSPVNTDEDVELFVIPKISYYGDNFYFENTTLGYSLVENEKWTLDLLSQFNLDAVYFHTNNDELNTFLNFLSADVLIILPFDPDIPFIEERDYSYMAGLAARWHFAHGYDVNLKLTRDVSGVHDGVEADFSLSHFGGAEGFGYSI
ncbi:MAG: MipA/OmpV family protein, partial [Kangiellaceae bacterium]|nr:MipA/OmpV family protein [Kangiellaceae bacterium]